MPANNTALSQLKIISWGLTLFLFSPIIALVIEALSQSSLVFQHLIDTVLLDYIINSLILVIGVCSMAIVWALPSAWLIARYQFPGQRFFRWALLLPMAMPAYLVAYVYTDLFDYSGPIQHFIRELFSYQNAQDYWFFEMRSMGGAIFVLSLIFSPYVYWLVSLNFNTQCQSLVNAGRLLGRSEWQIFWRVVLPLARPALAVSITLVAMETLADFGTVSYFSVWNITTAIYDTWLSLNDLSAAAKLACLLLLFVIILVILEKRSRRRIYYYQTPSSQLIRLPLSGWKKWLACSWCGLVIGLGFILPCSIIVYYAVAYINETDWPVFARMLGYSLFLAFSVASFAVLIALIVQLFQRFLAIRYANLPRQASHANLPRQIVSLGYAVPGTVLAIGVLIVSTSVDDSISHISEFLGLGSQGLLFSGTLFAMGYAFLCRFSAISIGSVEAGLSKISPSLDQTAYLYDYGMIKTTRTLFLPLLRNSLLTAFLLVFLESMKELSAAILLRPFNVETLATYVYQYMSAEAFEVAAVPAFIMLLAGLPTVLLLTYSMGKNQ
ncbi:MAG: ABC transporter permease [Ostreibacterium sp.]